MDIFHKTLNNTVLVTGAGGFIGHHLVTRLKNEGFKVIGADLKEPEYDESPADTFYRVDLREQSNVRNIFQENNIAEVYTLAADMGGAQYIFSGEHDAEVMHNSAQINLNIAEACKGSRSRVFYSSSACIYPAHNQVDPNHPVCCESSAYPANPDSEYGWEKLFSERLYLSYARNHNLSVRIARFHNIFGPKGTWKGGKEKAPAAICRKVIMAKDGDTIDIIGDGTQTRSFLYISECVEGILRLMNSDFQGPVNIGSEEMVTINQLIDMACSFENKHLFRNHILNGPVGVRGRNSDNRLIAEKLNWAPNYPLVKGLEKTYNWIKEQINN